MQNTIQYSVYASQMGGPDIHQPEVVPQSKEWWYATHRTPIQNFSKVTLDQRSRGLISQDIIQREGVIYHVWAVHGVLHGKIVTVWKSVRFRR